MKIFEIGTGYTSIPARMGAATEIVVAELTKSFVKLNRNVTIVDIKDRHRKESKLPIVEAWMPQFFSSTDTTLGIVHKLKRVLYSISLSLKLRRLISQCPPDEDIVLHFHNQYNLFFFLKLTPAALRRRVRIAYTVHSHVWFGKWEEIKDTVSRRYFQEVFCCRNADMVMVLNDVVARMLRDHYDVPAGRIIKVINGVNTDTYNGCDKDEAARDAVLDRYNLRGKKVLLQVGSVCDRKNQLGTLRLLAPVMKRDPQVAFIYAGGIIDAAYKAHIDQFVHDENIASQVHYVGEVSPGEELNRLYSIARGAFMNSRSEAFALVIAEALSARTPIFINDAIIASLPFIAGQVGKGVLRIGDDFEKQLHRLLTDDVFYAGQQQMGRDFVEKECSWDVAANNYLEQFIIKH